MLEAQRAAFFAELPVLPAVRRDRLRRAALMLEQNARGLAESLMRDQATQDAESAMRDEVVPGLLVLGEARQQVADWIRPKAGRGLLGGLWPGGDRLEYQPVGVVGIMAPAALPLMRTACLLAGALAAGNRVMLRLDAASSHLEVMLRELAPRYFDPRELAVMPGDVDEAGLDLLVSGEPAGEPAGALPARTGKSAVILGRSAKFPRAAGEVIAAKRFDGGRALLAPDIMLVPAEQEEAIAGWLWRAAMQAGTDQAPPLSAEACDRLAALLEDARARGGEVMSAEPRGAGMPLHIVRHATPDMRVMREEIAGPILPLSNYARIEDAIAWTNRLPPAPALYYLGQDPAERRRVAQGTLSSLFATDGQIRAAMRGSAGIPEMPLPAGEAEAGFRRFSRVRRTCRRSWPGSGGSPVREVEALGGAEPALR
ncbi:coniferyl-aldehyde dehydrogenase [Sphingomonas kyeonggiensis]|uniref:Coniferyl-aldehyde dehydrogenase n=1 Tax=Sphingomonas kyeonggiensis TaxID=1268553 RepID=A0A7W7NUB8_9SPHN|nr:aldehyde dehydrogenase family protein [Sphingomonas kyeonggiensis]MBB4840649.1 coniferyl-aldehyde dehydrogenase [Sphingomonas kyeonggiensis]